LIKKRYGIPFLLLLALTVGVATVALSMYVVQMPPTALVRPVAVTTHNIQPTYTMFAGESRIYHITVANRANMPVEAAVVVGIHPDPDGDNISAILHADVPSFPLGVREILDITGEVRRLVKISFADIPPVPPREIPARGSLTFDVTVTAAPYSPPGPAWVGFVVLGGISPEFTLRRLPDELGFSLTTTVTVRATT
jgi:hypothetical protein